MNIEEGYGKNGGVDYWKVKLKTSPKKKGKILTVSLLSLSKITLRASRNLLCVANYIPPWSMFGKVGIFEKKSSSQGIIGAYA